MNGLLVVGAGGHGKVVADTAIEMGAWDSVAFLDDKYPEIKTVGSFRVLGKIADAYNLIKDYSDISIGVGVNKLRLELISEFSESSFRIPNIIHPTAFVCKNVDISRGTVIFANSSINTSSKIGLGCIINTGAIVDHDCTIGDGVHISPGVNIAGNVNIGDKSWVGIGSSIINNINIGRDVIIGAGSVVISDIPDGKKAYGVPAKIN